MSVLNAISIYHTKQFLLLKVEPSILFINHKDEGAKNNFFSYFNTRFNHTSNPLYQHLS
jgi:hypothetical protein